jgi:hypothetical protein
VRDVQVNFILLRMIFAGLRASLPSWLHGAWWISFGFPRVERGTLKEAYADFCDRESFA